MKTYFEIVAEKNYHQLTDIEKEAIQDRQTALVCQWQDTTDSMKRCVIEDELMASLEGLIKGMAYRQSQKSFSVDRQDFEGIISLSLVETMVAFDRTLDKPFQPVFIINVRYAILEMYRAKGYDLHDTAQQLFKPTHEGEELHSELQRTSPSFEEDIEMTILTDEILAEVFGDNEKKKTIVHMVVQGFKRNEIITAINTDGRSNDAVARQINRTVNQFKESYLNLTHSM